MNTLGQKSWFYLRLVLAGLSYGSQAFAQPQTEPGAPAPEPPTPPAEPAPPPAEAPQAAEPAEPSAPLAPAATPAAAPAAPPTSAPPPAASDVEQPRIKPLASHLGSTPSAPDFGAEADMVSSAGVVEQLPPPKKWNRMLRGFFRAPLRIGSGPRNDGTEGHEFHSPPRIVGGNTSDWSYVGLSPDPTVSLYLNVENRNVVGTLILAASTYYDAGYTNLDQMGGVSQAYVTLRHHDLFGSRGGLSWTVGAFSDRYGMAGPRQTSSGFYGTYLFGRTHVAGERLTADLDLTDDLRVVVEHGLGAKFEVIPFLPLSDTPSTAPYLPDQGPVPQGSNYVHHAHASLLVSDWLAVSGHYLTSWSPNDLQPTKGVRAKEARMTIVGGEVHVDAPVAGSGYVGYSHIDAKRILPLADGIQVLHSGNGYDFAQNYFGPSSTPDPRFVSGVFLPTDTGTVDSISAQYMLRLAPLLGKPSDGPDLVWAVYGMFNHVTSTTLKGVDKLKLGSEVQVAPLRYVSAGVRFDRAMPDGHDESVAYSAISPRVIVHTNFMSKEYVIVSYTHYLLGENAKPSVPYALSKPDRDMLMISALISF